MFYSYMYLRDNGTPYYVGKGSGKRAFKHKTAPFPPKDKSKVIIFPMESESDAFESEIALIDLFGRKDIGTGILRNRTNGGDGGKGYVWTEEQIKRASENRKGEKCYWLFGKTGEGTPRFGVRIPHTKETKIKMSNTRIGRKLSDEHKASITAYQRSPEARALRSKQMVEIWRLRKLKQENGHRFKSE